MSKTHFSGPVKVGTNSNNTGWVVNAASDVYDASVDEGTSDETGTVKTTSIVIPKNSQIIDVNINVEVAFNNPLIADFTVTGASAKTLDKDSGTLAGFDVGATLATSGYIAAGSKIESKTGVRITLDTATTGAEGSQSCTFSSGKYLNVGLSTPSIGNIITKRLLTFDSTAGTKTGILFPKASADASGAWDDIQGADISRSVYFGFVDYAATKSTTGRVRVTIFYAQGRDLV